MEITKSPDGFKPFYMRIDSKEETEFLWHLLNNDMKTNFSDYLKKEKQNENKPRYITLKTEFFQKLQKQIKKQVLIREVQEE